MAPRPKKGNSSKATERTVDDGQKKPAHDTTVSDARFVDWMQDEGILNDWGIDPALAAWLDESKTAQNFAWLHHLISSGETWKAARLAFILGKNVGGETMRRKAVAYVDELEGAIAATPRITRGRQRTSAERSMAAKIGRLGREIANNEALFEHSEHRSAIIDDVLVLWVDFGLLPDPPKSTWSADLLAEYVQARFLTGAPPPKETFVDAFLEQRGVVDADVASEVRALNRQLAAHKKERTKGRQPVIPLDSKSSKFVLDESILLMLSS